jgi:outer membrane protein assembly factor BamB
MGSGGSNQPHAVVQAAVASLSMANWHAREWRGEHGLEAGTHQTTGPVSPEWLAVYKGPEKRGVMGAFVGHSPDGQRVVVAGTNGPSVVAFAYAAATGEPLWTEQYTARRAKAVTLAEVALCPIDERLYLAGWAYGPAGVSNFILAYSASSGRLLWEVRQREGIPAMVSRLLVALDGSRVFLLSRQEGDPLGSSNRVQVRSTKDGRLLWAKDLPRPVGHDLAGGCLTASADGRTVFYAGALYDRGLFSGWHLAALDAADGSERWHVTLSPEGERKETWQPTDFADEYRVAGIAASPAGDRFFFLGSGLDRAEGRASLLAMAVSESDGEPLWTVTQSQARMARPLAMALAPAADGAHVVVAAKWHGQAVNTSTVQVLSLAANDGQVHWETEVRAGNPEFGVPLSLRPSLDGKTMMLAVDSGAEDFPFLTIGWRAATGEEQWRVRTGTSAPVPAFPRGMSLSPDGRQVAVIGRPAPANPSPHAFTMVAYRLEPAGELPRGGDGPTAEFAFSAEHPPSAPVSDAHRETHGGR